VPKSTDFDYPSDDPDERELLLAWLDYLRGAVARNIDGVSEEDAHDWPDGRLLPLVGIVNHCTHLEERWIDGGFLDATITRSDDEFFPGPELTIVDAVSAYRARARATEALARRLPLDALHRTEDATLRWVLLHLINETARHAGHADAVRELLDGATGE
jgi:Protein of unknown function (DUF664)